MFSPLADVVENGENKVAVLNGKSKARRKALRKALYRLDRCTLTRTPASFCRGLGFGSRHMEPQMVEATSRNATAAF